MVQQNSCPICSGTTLTHYLTCTDHLVSRKEFELLRCSSCGFILTSAPPDETHIGAFYESDEYISHSDSGKTFLDKVYREVRKIMLSRKRRLVIRNTIKQTGKILDFGCGTGHFLNEMKRAGWDATGVEVNKKARDHAASGFGLEVFPPEAVRSLPDNEYDCITLWHVLEHINEPSDHFSEIKRLLKPGGAVLVALPNSDSFDALHYGNVWAAFDVPRHLWHFNPSTFSKFAAKAGFTITSLKILPFDVFYISILSEKHKGAMFPSFSGLVMGKIYFFLSLFSRKRGSSIVYCLKADTN
jgi:2-polyprenyl-3-methyl-5-hydroxy-6-metoxy-1,4-benzoquinol methylase